MRNIEITKNGVTFNRSKKTEWVVVHDGTELKHFGTGGITSSKKTMFVGTKSECETYIAENKIIIPEEE